MPHGQFNCQCVLKLQKLNCGHEEMKAAELSVIKTAEVPDVVSVGE